MENDAPGAGRSRTDWHEFESPSMAVVHTVSMATDRPAEALPPLAEAIPADALDAVVTRPTTGDGRRRVTFEYARLTVTVSSEGAVAVEPVDRDTWGSSLRSADDVTDGLRELFTAAADNGVSIQGGWAIRNGPSYPDWDVHITRVAKRDGAPDR